MRIVVVAVGKLRPPFADDVAHYTKLLAGHAKVDMIEVREDEAHRRPQAGGRIERRIPRAPAGGGPGAFVSLLALDGEVLDSVGFSRFIEERRMSGRDLCFVIGGPHGLHVERADHRLSLGALTLPHQLARVVLLEQLYRAHKILKNEPYHH